MTNISIKTKKECQRCGEINLFFSSKTVAKLNLSVEEKEYIFKNDVAICACCVLQLKTRFRIKENISILKNHKIHLN